MKVIFLDIDGVLITANNSHNSLHDEPRSSGEPNGFNRDAVDNLNSVIEKTDAKIVISSSLRFSNSARQLVSILQYGGVNNPPVIDVTPVIPDMRTKRSHRGNEILAWLSRHPDVEDYVVIDDCGKEQLANIPDNRVVSTSYREGFGTEEAYRKAVQALIKNVSGNGNGK